ncbi:MAG: cation:proton antiporter [Vulcanimicrobiota bacterium]
MNIFFGGLFSDTYLPDNFITIGVVLLLGALGNVISEKLKSPKVVLYVIIGLIIGRSGMNFINKVAYEQIEIISVFALAMIGFAIGGELKYEGIKELGKTIPIITVFQSVVTFSLVLLGVFFFTKNWVIALILGAIASATDPAAPVNVLWQYGARGALTTTIISVVGLDDALTLILYAFAGSISRVIFTGGGNVSILNMLLMPLFEIGGSLLLGLVLGFVLHKALKYLKGNNEILILTLSLVLGLAGLARQFHMSMILSCMAAGIFLINASPRNQVIFDSIHQFIQPFLVILFVLVGSFLDIFSLKHIGVIGIIYIVTRSIGKILGSWTGAEISGAKPEVKKYLGVSLLCQAGVAIGLAMEASHSFAAAGPEGRKLAATIMTVTVATVFIFEILGPPLVKHAIFKTREVACSFLEETGEKSEG